MKMKMKVKIGDEPKTAFQKIIDEHLVAVLPDGSMVLDLDRIWGHEITTPVSIIDMQDQKCDVVFDPNKIKMMIDHVNPAGTTASAIQGRIIREWSKEHGIEFLDVGRNGICHAIIPEKGWVMPGMTAIMGDSHTCTHGAFGALTLGVGSTELEIGLITGLVVLPPQKVIRVNFTGELPANVFAKDIILALIKKIGVDGATNAVLEFGGPIIDKMGMEGRMTIANMAVEAGATSGMMMFDSHTLDYLWPAIEEIYEEDTPYSQILADLQRFNSDPGVKYDQVVEIDVSDMVPVITINQLPEDVVSVAEIANKKVDQIYIGSCTNGRIEDLIIAASILADKKIADNVRCIIVPATQHIYKRALEEGLIATFIEAGCIVSSPTCGACLGMSNGVIAPDEICVSTTNRNFSGRMGKGGIVHLVSPATAALTAIEGRITEPTIEMCEQALNNCRAIITSGKEAVQLTDWKNVPFKKPNYNDLSKLVDKGPCKDFSGKVLYLLIANINTDQIIPAIYLTETEKVIFGKHCLEDIPTSLMDRTELHNSQIIVAGENFGSGSSREHAPWALESAGIRCVIAPSFARIFETNMFANGLLCITLPKEIIDCLSQKRPEELSIDWENGIIRWDNDSVRFEISERQKDLIRNGGSVSVMLKLAAKLQKEGKI